MNTQQVDDYIQKLSEQELIDFAKQTAQRLSRLSKSKAKALEAELSASAYVSRAKRTTLVANAGKVSDQYSKQVELLKYVVSKL